MQEHAPKLLASNTNRRQKNKMRKRVFLRMNVVCRIQTVKAEPSCSVMSIVTK